MEAYKTMDHQALPLFKSPQTRRISASELDTYARLAEREVITGKVVQLPEHGQPLGNFITLRTPEGTLRGVECSKVRGHQALANALTNANVQVGDGILIRFDGFKASETNRRLDGRPVRYRSYFLRVLWRAE